MRVLFTTWAWPSHYYPMVPLAWSLRAAGHEVRMTSQPALLPAMRLSGLPVTAVGRDLDVAAVYHKARALAGPGARTGAGGPPPGRAKRFSDHLSVLVNGRTLARSYEVLRGFEDESIALFRALWEHSPLAKPWRLSLYGEVAQAMVEDLLTLARAWRPDLIVFDPLTYAGPLVARLIGIPAVRTLFGPDVTYFTDSTGMAEVLDRYGLAELDLLGTSTVDPCPPSLQLPDSVAPTRRLRTRYVPYNGLSDVPSWLPDEPERPRICLTWGTSIHRLLGDGAFLPGDVLPACAKLAEERNAELVLAITANQRHLLPDVPTSVRVLESVPLNDLLPTCQALIHQGGAGTTLTALRHGLPQLVLPQLFDEATNAFLLLATEAGVTQPAATTAAADLIATGHELLDNPTHRVAAARLRQEIHDLPTPAETVADLVALV
jgi:UDP:flavonoid glycosyltransferase YjiC (YdhE family)